MARLLFVIPVLVFLSCQKQGKVFIDGDVTGTHPRIILLEEFIGESARVLDSTETRKDGSFRFVFRTGEPQFLRIGSGAGRINLLVEPGEKLHIRVGSPGWSDNYTVSGSEGSALVKELDDRFRITRQRIDSIITRYRSLDDVPANSEQKETLAAAYQAAIDAQRKYSIGFILEHMNSLASLMALYQKLDEETFVLYKTYDLQYLKITLDSLRVYYPDSKYTTGLANDLNNQMSALRSMRLQQTIDKLGASGIDIRLPNHRGDTVSLSSLKGKYVLLSFWASWNQQSVSENLNLLQYYKRYHPRGFEVYQVSLDNNATNWKKAIEYEGLPWINVSELSYPASSTDKIFNVRQLPANYLINKKGEIIDKNLFGNALRIKLSQIYD